MQPLQIARDASTYVQEVHRFVVNGRVLSTERQFRRLVQPPITSVLLEQESQVIESEQAEHSGRQLWHWTGFEGYKKNPTVH